MPQCYLAKVQEGLNWRYWGRNIVGMELELDYSNWRTVGDAGNAPLAHVLLDTLYTGKVVFSLIWTVG